MAHDACGCCADWAAFCLWLWEGCCCVGCHQRSISLQWLRWLLEGLVLSATLVLSVFALHDDWDLFHVGYLYPLHVVAWSLEVIHGARCHLPNHRILDEVDKPMSEGQRVTRVCFALLTASAGALLADLLVLGQGSRALDAHRATTEYTQLALVLALTLLSLWRLLGPNQPHLARLPTCLLTQDVDAPVTGHE